MSFDPGPQVDGEHGLKKKARWLQSQYRTTVLKEDYGFGPQPNSKKRYGNMLINGETTGSNFLTRDIFEYALQRVADKHNDETIDAYRLFNNMLSSMPLCFNLFVPLKSEISSGAEWVSEAFHELLPQYDIATITDIQIEFIPTPKEDYINDKSAFDAFTEFVTSSGEKGIIGIETKYIDNLGKNNPKDMGTKKKVATDSACFTKEGIASLQDECPQIVRNFLLSESFRMKHRYRHSHSLILSPEKDRQVVEEMEDFKLNLNASGKAKISKITLERFADTIGRHCPDSHRQWINEFIKRYLEF